MPAPDSIAGDFSDVRLVKAANPQIGATSPQGVPIAQDEFLLYRRDDEFWAKVTAIDEQGGRHYVEDVRIVMTTGSHHYQMYWTSPEPDRTLIIFPFVYLLEDRRWVPRESALITPPNAHQGMVLWNGICIRCHSTHGQPRIDLQGKHRRHTCRRVGHLLRSLPRSR